MEIEVITTKKKLSKATVKQLEKPTIGDLNQVFAVHKIGYYVRDLGKGYADRVALFQGINGWRCISIRDWSAVKDRPFVTAKAISGRGFSIKKFDDYKSRDLWLDAYNKMKNLCLKNHLIL